VHPIILRWLGQNDPLRRGYGQEGPPAPRTHDKACAEGLESDGKPHHTWDSKAHVRLTTGINHWCPLSVLHKFDMIWDFCPDMMHIVKTFFERLVLGVFSGSRKPEYKHEEPKKPPRDASDEDRALYQNEKRKYNARVKEYNAELQRFAECIFTEADRKLVDRRVQNLVGFPYWIKGSLVPQHTHKTHFLKSCEVFVNLSTLSKDFPSDISFSLQYPMIIFTTCTDY
jgi:hypothetical protein